MDGQLSGRRGLPSRVTGFLFLMAAVGCGGRTAAVSGKVTYKGEPLTAGYVIFHASDGRADSGRIGGDGNYTVYKAPVGDVKVAIRTADPNRRPPPAGLSKSKNAVKRPDSESTGTDSIGKFVSIPARYQDPEQSGFTFAVKPGQQTINLELKP